LKRGPNKNRGIKAENGATYTERFGPDYFKEIGRKGGVQRSEKKRLAALKHAEREMLFDPDHFRKMRQLVTPRPRGRPPLRKPTEAPTLTCPICLTAYPLVDPRTQQVIVCCGMQSWYHPRAEFQ